MGDRQFILKATVNSDSPSAVKPVIEQFIGTTGIVSETDSGFAVKAVLEGRSARELNRMLLSEMRRVEKKTRLRAEWTSDKITESFFDYVPKGKHRIE